jgi:hypothetical protein
MAFNLVGNYLYGEEFLFRGLLLPRMHRVFGKWDWLANSVLFGLYHVHKPLDSIAPEQRQASRKMSKSDSGPISQDYRYEESLHPG